MADQGVPPAGTPAAPAAPVEQAEIDALRSTSRWLVAASGAIFALLTAGIQVSALGRLIDYPGRLALALTASTLALAAAAAVLIQAVRVLVDAGWTLGSLAKLAVTPRWKKHWLNDPLGGQRGMLGLGATRLDLPALYRKFVQLREAWSTYQTEGTVKLASDLDVPAGPTTTYTAANISVLRQRLDHYEDIAQKIASAASLIAARRRFTHLKNLLIAVALVPIAAVPLFAAAVTLPPESLVTSPTAVLVELFDTPDSRQALATVNLAPGCTGRHLPATAVGGTLSEPIVVGTFTPECPLRRLLISRDLGIAFPANPR